MRVQRPALSLIAGLIAIAGSLLPAMAGTSTFHLEVMEKDRSEPKVRVEMPLDVVEALASSIHGEILERAQPLAHLNEHGFDVRAFWQQIRASDIREFVTIETEEAHVRGWREDGWFRLTVRALQEDDERRITTVDVRLPEALMDAVTGETEAPDLGFLVAKLRTMGPMTLLEVKSDGDSVRVWID